MAYIFLVFAMCSSAVLSIMSSFFNRKNPDCKNISSLYNVIVTLSAFLTWGIIYLTKFSFNSMVLLYSAGYGISYTIAMMGLFKALEAGSVSLTAFVKQLSLIAVAFWGFFFWGSSISLNIIIGIVLIIAALYLCFRPGKENKSPVSLKWLLYASMLLVGNAGCSIIQKYQQMAFSGEHGNMLMFFGTIFAFIICLVKYNLGEKCRIKDVKKSSLICPVIAGMSSALLNLFILLLLSSTISESITFPTIAVGGLILTTLFSVVFYKEKLFSYQWAGLFVGAVALVFLNL